MEVGTPDQHRVITADRDDGGWPLRTQRLVSEVRSLCRTWLRDPLQLCLGDFDRRLLEIADRTRSHMDQQRYLASRQRLLQERQAFEDRFIASVDNAFSGLGAGSVSSPRASQRQPLSLLEPLEHEMTAALDQLVARSEARCGPLLVELSYRLAVLIGAPPLEAESLPLGPQAMAKAFRDASAALGLPTEHHLLLLQSLEGTLIHGLTPLYEMINGHLQADGILPQLRAFPLPRAASRAPRPAPVADAAADRPAERLRPAPAIPSAPVTRAVPSALATVHGLLSAAGTTEAGRAASPQQLQAALGVLQQRAQVAGAALPQGPRLRDAVLAELQAGQPAGAARIGLGEEQRNIIELVARLFEQIDRQLPPDSVAHELLARLLSPILRTAIADPDLLARRTHPSQQLLGTILEAARDWVDNDASEAARLLHDKLEQLVDQIGREPPRTGVHTRLLAGLEQHLTQLKRKAQVAEKRHVEAMQGRERLEQARHRASELMAERFARAEPRGLLRTLLDRAWSDVLALTLLRHGEQSEAFACRLVVTDQLLGQLPAGDPRQLQEEVETGLAQIGMHGDEAVQVAQRLLGALATSEDRDVSSATDLALRLRQRQRLGEAQTTDAPTAVDTGPTGPEEMRIHQRLLGSAGGSWFEFVDPLTGRSAQRKLAWSSPLSGRSLFVTHHGQRAEEMTLAQLARAIAAGQVRELPSTRGDVLDQAWQALDSSLRQAGRTPGIQR
jgi:hypothetical protein